MLYDHRSYVHSGNYRSDLHQLPPSRNLTRPAGLYDRLVDRFGEDQVFKDVGSIAPGDDFIEVITSAVGSCDVLLALIGDRWLTIVDEAGDGALTTLTTSCG